MANYVTLPSISANKVLTASYVNQLNSNLTVIGLHNHSGSLGEGNSVLFSSSTTCPFVNRYEVIAHIAPSQLNFSTSSQDNAYIFGAYRQSDTAVPASIKFPLGLFSGEYNFSIMHEKNTNLGTASIIIGTSTVGELDTYAATGSKNIITTFSASIPTTASYVLTISSSGKKNASSTGSIIRFQAFKIRKTGGY